MSRVPAQRAVRGLTASRTILGGALLVAPREILQPLKGDRIDPSGQIYARVLGIRHLIEAAVTAKNPDPRIVRVGAGIDTVHALSTLWLMRSPTHRRLGVWNLVSALSFGAVGWWLGRRDLRED